jgi:hypothetical protein
MKLFRRNWLYETKTQELERRIRALEASVQEAHGRINGLYREINIMQTKNADMKYDGFTPEWGSTYDEDAGKGTQ